MELKEWSLNAFQEYQHAIQAEQTGNQGKARVCARRCAGWLLRIANTRLGLPVKDLNAYELIVNGAEQPAYPAQAREILKDMLKQVDVNGHLPQDINLIASCPELAQLFSIELSETISP